MHNLDDYAPLWTTERDDYALIEMEMPDNRIGYVIFHLPTRQAVIIDDKALSDEVKQLMAEAGVAIYDSLPD